MGATTLDDLMAEAALILPPATMPADDERRRSDLAERRRRVVDAYVEGLYERHERDERIAAIDAEESALAARQVAVVGAIDWRLASPRTINAVLRTLWRAVRLDAGMEVVDVEWILPDLRSPGGRTANRPRRGSRRDRGSGDSQARHARTPV